MSSLIQLTNYAMALKNATNTITAVQQARLQQAGDYELVAFQVPPAQHQKPHYHTYGDIDIFMVIEGEGRLHLAKIFDKKIVAGSEEIHDLKKGDTYRIKPYVLHSIENSTNHPILMLNIAPGAHSSPFGGVPDHIVDIFFPET